MTTTVLQEHLDELLQRADGMDFTVSEETQRVPAITEVVPGVRDLLDSAVEVLRAIQQLYESDAVLQKVVPEDSDPDSLTDIGVLISTEMAARGIADLAFVARGDLMACRQELAKAVERESYWQMASRCDTGYRHLRRALISVESAIYEFEGREPPRRPWVDLSTSLEIREAFGGLRRSVLVDENDPALDVEARLHRMAERLVALRGERYYPLLRFDDRVAVRRLYQRIVEWQEGRADEEVTGQRLWRDVVGFAELLRQINHREELREHDIRTVATLLQKLGPRGTSPKPLSEKAQEELFSLRGLDNELDGLLEVMESSPDESPPDELRTELERLQRSMLPGAGRRGPF
ncbi:MAG: hypothetical protein SX243_09455 [Acidobacteriota bacterium]|nr:hypothetical protein [Acidobacteriota bacterium]